MQPLFKTETTVPMFKDVLYIASLLHISSQFYLFSLQTLAFSTFRDHQHVLFKLFRLSVYEFGGIFTGSLHGC